MLNVCICVVLQDEPAAEGEVEVVKKKKKKKVKEGSEEAAAPAADGEVL